jgi:linoleate 9S-lipoxygenase
VGAEASLEQWLTSSLPSLTTGESRFGVTFDWDVDKLGVPGAIIVKNHHSNEFFLKTITLDDVPGRAGAVVFLANSWVYPADKYRYDRVFFANDVSSSLLHTVLCYPACKLHYYSNHLPFFFVWPVRRCFM